MADQAIRILLDWGTSSLRAFLMGSGGAVLDRRTGPHGIAAIKDRQFEAPLRAMLGPWLANHGPLPIFAFGMIGSRNGWVEMPYAPCPARMQDVAAYMRPIELSDGLSIIFAPGLSAPREGAAPDVMRGEEAHLFGLPDDGPAIAVLPGTHSKWAKRSAGKVETFQTFVTGELFGLLAEHSFVVSATGGDAGDPWPAFDRGLELGLSREPAEAGLLARLFGIRTRMLNGQLDPEEAQGFLSGLLIGREFEEARGAGWFAAGDALTILGTGDLVDAYCRAANRAGLAAEPAGADIMISGADKIADAYEARPHDA